VKLHIKQQHCGAAAGAVLLQTTHELLNRQQQSGAIHKSAAYQPVSDGYQK